jgi:hypothetical protein
MLEQKLPRGSGERRWHLSKWEGVHRLKVRKEVRSTALWLATLFPTGLGVSNLRLLMSTLESSSEINGWWMVGVRISSYCWSGRLMGKPGERLERLPW